MAHNFNSIQKKIIKDKFRKNISMFILKLLYFIIILQKNIIFYILPIVQINLNSIVLSFFNDKFFKI